MCPEQGQIIICPYRLNQKKLWKKTQNLTKVTDFIYYTQKSAYIKDNLFFDVIIYKTINLR